MDSSSLLSLPTELRLRIYEFAYDATLVGSRLVWSDRFSLTVRGSPTEDEVVGPRIYGSPFTLLRVCRKLNQEIIALLPVVSDISLNLDGLSQGQAAKWLALTSAEQLAQLRHINITVWDKCHLRRTMYKDGHRYDCHFDTAGICDKRCQEASLDAYDSNARHGLCDRSLELDLTVFERDFDADRWHNLLNADHRVQSISNGYIGGPVYDTEYYKGYYLLRNMIGCVELFPPLAHPERQQYQCNSVVDIQRGLAALLTYEGRLRVTKEALLLLMDSARGDGFQGGSSERYLRVAGH